MNPSTPMGSPSVLRQLQLPGMLIFFAVVFGGQYLAHRFQEPVMQWLALHGGSPGDAPPWYFITQDFAEGICSLAVFLLSLGVAAAIWRWWSGYAGTIIWMSLIYHGGNISRSWIIYKSCPGLLDGQRITSRWPTFDSYLGDPQVALARTLVLGAGILLALVLAVVSNYFQFRNTRRILRSLGEIGRTEGGGPQVD